MARERAKAISGPGGGEAAITSRPRSHQRGFLFPLWPNNYDVSRSIICIN